MKKAYIIHGWGGSSREPMLVSIASALKGKGYEVALPEMPDTDHPKIEAWVGHLSEIVKNPDPNTYFIGHSIGCQAILRYLETLPENTKIGGAVFIAPWFTLQELGEEEDPQIAEPWIDQPMNFGKIKSHFGKLIAIFSTNDPYVASENQKMFADRLGAKIILIKNAGHFTEDDGITELPVVVEKIG